ncbi:hypothetical protein TR51_30850 [Kitasatospora griseola]|uniref:Uncharacterized protein n=1 Tax=Kitasatospora griseola TaxID=2064 RepID=A0A0D0NVG5_KITGR|nr:hypothetical protein [Kitasatospora griseola]KIQ63166.1 hypothetical protein TR51_30850 [Kitasatospora griseola]
MTAARCAGQAGTKPRPAVGPEPRRPQNSGAAALLTAHPVLDGSAEPGSPVEEFGVASQTGPGCARRASARACSRWDCSAEPVGPQVDSGAAPTPSAEPGRARRDVVANSCSRWDCLPDPAAPTLELVA